MLKDIRIDVVVLIILTVAITVFVLNATTEFGPLATGQIGIGGSEATEAPTAEVEATVEVEATEVATEEATVEAEATEAATIEVTEIVTEEATIEVEATAEATTES